MNHQEYRVFHFGFTASGKRHNVAVASTSREEARALIPASFDNVLNLRERIKKAGKEKDTVKSDIPPQHEHITVDKIDEPENPVYQGKLMGTPFTNGYRYYCPIRLEFVEACSSCRCSPDDKPLIETQEALVSHLSTTGRDPAIAWFALSGRDPLPGSDCAASPDQIRSIMAYAKGGCRPEYAAAKKGLPLSLVLNVFRFFGIPHASPDKKGAAPERHNPPAARRAR